MPIRRTPRKINGSTVVFNSAPVYGVFVNIPESTNYTLVYSLNIPATPNYSGGVPYDLDLRAYATPPTCRFDVVVIEGDDLVWLRAAFDAA